MDMQNVTTPEVNQEAPKSKLGLFALIGVVLVTVLGGGVYYFGFAGKDAPPSLPSGGGMQGYIAGQASGIPYAEKADVDAWKVPDELKTATLAEVTMSKDAFAYFVAPKTMSLKEIYEKYIPPVEKQAVMVAIYDAESGKFITTKQSKQAWKTVTTVNDAKVVAKDQGFIVFGTSPKIKTYLKPVTTEPASVDLDKLQLGWNLTGLSKINFENVMKLPEYTAVYNLNSTTLVFEEVSDTVKPADLKNFLFWVKKVDPKTVTTTGTTQTGTGTTTTPKLEVTTTLDGHDKLVTTWKPVSTATTYEVTVDGKRYTVDAVGKVSPETSGVTSEKKADGSYSLTITGVTKTTVPVIVEAFKDSTAIAGAKEEKSAVKATATGTVVDLGTKDGLAIEAEPQDKAVLLQLGLRPDQAFSEEESAKIIKAFKGLTLAYKVGTTDKSATLTYDQVKFSVSGNTDVTIEDAERGIFKVPGLANGTEYTFTATALYDGYKSTPATVKATPKAGAVATGSAELKAVTDAKAKFDALIKQIEDLAKVITAEEAKVKAFETDTDITEADKTAIATAVDKAKKALADMKTAGEEASTLSDTIKTDAAKVTDATEKVTADKASTDAQADLIKAVALFNTATLTVKTTEDLATKLTTPAGDVTVVDALTATATGGDKTVAIKITKLEVGLALGSESKFKGLAVQYNDGADKTAMLDATYDATAKKYTFPAKSPDTKVTWDATTNTITISELTNSANEQPFRVGMVYDTGYISTVSSVTVNAVVNVAGDTVVADALAVDTNATTTTDTTIKLSLTDLTVPDAEKDQFEGLKVTYFTSGDISATPAVEPGTPVTETFPDVTTKAKSNDVSYGGTSTPKTLTISGLTASTEYSIKLELTYKTGFTSKTGVVSTSAGTVATAGADPLTVTSDTTDSTTSTLTAQEYNKFTFTNSSTDSMLITSAKLQFNTAGSCAYVGNIIVKELPAMTGTCDVDTITLTGELAVPPSGTAGLTPQFDIQDAAKDSYIFLALTEVNYKDTAGKTYTLIPTNLGGGVLSVDKNAVASLNYGFASLFDNILDSLFNLFR